MEPQQPLPRILPTRLALALAAKRGRRSWREAAVRDAARATAEAIVGPGPQVDAVARAHLAATAAREEFILRPWANRHDAVHGVEHLRAARIDGRGVVVSYCHAGPFTGLGATTARSTHDVHNIVGDWLFDDQPDPGLRRRQLAWRSMLEDEGVPLLPARGSFHEAVRLLSRGCVVFLSFDMPGSQQTEFLGRPVMLASGTARMAAASDALVVPAARRLLRYRPHSFFAPALDSRDHQDWRSLHDALAAVHSRSILERPATLEDPRRGGAWGPGATADAWLPAVPGGGG